MKCLFAMLLIVTKLQAQFCKPYCSSTCTPGTTQCQTGCLSPYIFNATAPFPCALNTSTQLLFDSELPSESNFTALGFSSTSSLATMSCIGTLTYFFLGPFVANNYIYKAFSGIGTNHYRIDVLWSFGIFGTWTGQQLSAIFIDGNGVVTQLANQGQACGVNQTTLNGCTTSNTGCFTNMNKAIVHNSDFLSVNFSSMGSAISTSSAVQAWGVKDLLIVVSKCDSTCSTCYGSLATNCASCPTGLYLQGSICILTCPFYAIPATAVCVTSCPAYYYTNTYNSFCEPCPTNCSTCQNSTTCIDWAAGTDLSNPLRDYLAVWIILAAVLVTLIAVLLWKFCCSKKTFYDTMQEEVIDHKKVEPRPPRNLVNQSTQKMEARWVQDIDQLHLPKPQAKRSKIPGQIQGIGIELTNL